LTHYLPASQPVYALRDPNVVRDGVPCDTIEEMAVYYKEAVQAIQPQGPYHLVGWSFGGIAALEVARLLRKDHHEVRLLGLIESVLPETMAANPKGPRAKILLGNVWRTIRSGIGITLDGYHAILRNNRRAEDARQSVMSRIEQLWNSMAWSLFLKRTNLAEVMSKNAQLVLIEQPSVRDFGRISNANVRALRRYSATPYDGTIAVFRGDGGVNVGRSAEPAQGWDDYALGGVRVFTIQGDHFSIMRNPHAQGLARSIEACLGHGLDGSLNEIQPA
jgi:thioesterase domain-containing protein